MATGRITLDTGSTLHTATHTISEDAVTKHLSRGVLSDSAGAEKGINANPLIVTISGGTLAVLTITGSTSVINTVTITGSTTVLGTVTITGSTSVINTVTITGSTAVLNIVSITGSTAMLATVAGLESITPSSIEVSYTYGTTAILTQTSKGRLRVDLEADDFNGVDGRTAVAVNDTYTHRLQELDTLQKMQILYGTFAMNERASSQYTQIEIR